MTTPSPKASPGCSRISRAIRSSPPICAPTCTYSLAVAGTNAGAPISAVYDGRSKLSPYGVALLGLAMEQVKDARAASTRLLARIARSQQNPEEASWAATRDPLLDFSDDASAEATAFAVKFLSHQKPDSPLLPKAALWLMNHRNEGYWWSSTKQTAMVIYGLIDYLRATNELNRISRRPCMSTARRCSRASSIRRTALTAPELTLDESKLAARRKSHPRRLPRAMAASITRREPNIPRPTKSCRRPAPSRSTCCAIISSSRQARTATASSTTLNPLNGPVAAGDIVAVRLTVTGSEWKYLMVEDPIPAGTEFIERDNVYEIRSKPPWWQYFFTRRELHDDRMAIFQTYFPQGQQQYFYLLKVVNPGVFQVSPARVQPMYQPGVMATSESRRLEAK